MVSIDVCGRSMGGRLDGLVCNTHEDAEKDEELERGRERQRGAR